jgi:ketosteroid isomerase-like protein
MIRNLACAAALLFAVPAAAADQDVLKPIRAFIAAANTNDAKTMVALHVASPSIIDEFPPHHWSGPDAISQWGADFAKDAALHGDTDPKMTIVRVNRVTESGDHAYAIVSTDYSYKRKGVAMTEHGTISYALDHTPDGWRIASWAYSW